MNEFVIEWVRGDKEAFVTAPNNTALKNKLLKYAESHKDEVIIISNNSDGSIVAKVPVKWIKCSPPRQLSEEQRIQAAERLRKLRGEANE